MDERGRRRCKAADEIRLLSFHNSLLAQNMGKAADEMSFTAFDCTFAHSSLFAQNMGSERAVPVAFLPP